MLTELVQVLVKLEDGSLAAVSLNSLLDKDLILAALAAASPGGVVNVVPLPGDIKMVPISELENS